MAQSHDEQRKQLTLLWTKAQPNVTAFISSLVPQFHDAEDLLQQVAAAVAENFNDYDPDRPFVGWAIGIARHKVYDHLRSAARDRHVFDSDAITDIAAAYTRTEPQLAQVRKALDECMEKVHGRPAKVLELRYVRDLKPSAIAAKLGMSANAVYVMLHRVREALGQCVKRKLAAVMGGDQ